MDDPRNYPLISPAYLCGRPKKNLIESFQASLEKNAIFLKKPFASTKNELIRLISRALSAKKADY